LPPARPDGPIVRLIALRGGRQPIACRKTHFRICHFDFDIRYSRPSTPTFSLLCPFWSPFFRPYPIYDLHPVVHQHPPRYHILDQRRAYYFPRWDRLALSPSAFIGLRQHSLLPFRFVCRPNRKNILSHNANDTITCLCRCFCTKVNMQHRAKFQSRALVDGHTQENKSDKATS